MLVAPENTLEIHSVAKVVAIFEANLETTQVLKSDVFVQRLMIMIVYELCEERRVDNVEGYVLNVLEALARWKQLNASRASNASTLQAMTFIESRMKSTEADAWVDSRAKIDVNSWNNPGRNRLYVC